MKKNKSRPLALLAMGMLWSVFGQAQESVNASGGDASGSGGSVAYSIGQIVYTTNTGSSGSVAKGVQHAYEIFTLEINDTTFDNLITVFPNPTTHNLTLNIGEGEFSTLNFQLYDINGKLIESRKIVSRIETIGMENLPSATYFLKVSNNNNEVKTFKIIKNNIP